MPRQELNSDNVKIEQKEAIVGDLALKERAPEIVHVDASDNEKIYLDELKFNEEPVTIRLEPSTDKNAATVFPIWVNGKGAEVFQHGEWQEIKYLPVGIPMIVKRKYVAVLATAKIDTVTTQIEGEDSERPNNKVNRYTSAIHSFSVIEDKNPRGAAWLTELRRRNF